MQMLNLSAAGKLHGRSKTRELRTHACGHMTPKARQLSHRKYPHCVPRLFLFGFYYVVIDQLAEIPKYFLI